MLECVGTLTKCPYTAGGRSRRGSLKAGTAVFGERLLTCLAMYSFVLATETSRQTGKAKVRDRRNFVHRIHL